MSTAPPPTCPPPSACAAAAPTTKRSSCACLLWAPRASSPSPGCAAHQNCQAPLGSRHQLRGTSPPAHLCCRAAVQHPPLLSIDLVEVTHIFHMAAWLRSSRHACLGWSLTWLSPPADRPGVPHLVHPHVQRRGAGRRQPTVRDVDQGRQGRPHHPGWSAAATGDVGAPGMK